MSKEWIEFFHDCLRLGLFLSLIPVLIFLAYYVDLKLCPKPFQVIRGDGKKSRRPRQSLEVVE